MIQDMKPYVLISSFLLIFQTTALNQSTFNKRFHFDFPAVLLTSLISTDTAYYAIGVIADSIAPYKKSNIFVRFDLLGNPTSIRTIRDTGKTHETWRSTLIETYDGGFAAVGYSFDQKMNALFIKYDNNGDTLYTKKHGSIFSPENDFIYPRALVQAPDSGFVLVSAVYNPNSFNNGDISISRLDKLGNLEWQKAFGNHFWDDPLEIISTEGGYVIGSTRSNINLVDKDFVSQCHIFKVDHEGNIAWQYFSPHDELFFGANKIFISPLSSDLIILSKKGVEEPININAGNLKWNNYIFSLDSDRNFQWGTFFRDSFPVNLDLNSLNKIVYLPEEPSYIIAGNILDMEQEAAKHKGLLAKISLEGDSIWSRYFNYVDNETTFHYLYDLEKTSDNGFIMCGQAKDAAETPQGQQAWLLKVDEHGCLVPGCHLTTDLEETDTPFLDISIYPNPTSDYLNVFIPQQPIKNTAIRLLNINGQEINFIDSISLDTTFIIPVNTWEKGAYILQWLDENGNTISSQQFIVN